MAEAAASVPGAGAATAAPTPAGLVAERSGPCAGLLRVAVVSPAACTHGPHAPPAGLAVDRTAITGQV